MKYIKKFQTNADYQTFKDSSDWVTPNVSLIEEKVSGNDFNIMFEPFVGSAALFTFTVNGNQYQAEEGMTFYDWALSEYYDSSCKLTLALGGTMDLRDNIINKNISYDDSYQIWTWAGATLTPVIYTDTIIQPISYKTNSGAFDPQ